MSRVWAANRLADHLDHVLPPQDQRVPEHGSDPLIDVALRLARGPHPTLNPDQLLRIKTQLLARVNTSSSHD